jgi:hypothetical protein
MLPLETNTERDKTIESFCKEEGLATSFPPSSKRKKTALSLFESKKREKHSDPSPLIVERVQDTGLLSLQELKEQWKIGLFCAATLAEIVIWKQTPRSVLALGFYWIMAEIIFPSSKSSLIKRTAQGGMQALRFLKRSAHNQDIALGALGVIFIASGSSLNVKIGSLIILFTLGREWVLYATKQPRNLNA